MDVIALDASFNPTAYVEGYLSFIWTERFIDVSDFQITFASSNATLTALLVEDQILIHSETRVPMYVETITQSEDANGILVTTVTGRGFEAFLENRVTSPLNPLNATSLFTSNQIMSQAVEDNISSINTDTNGNPSSNGWTVYDIVPNWVYASSTPADTTVPAFSWNASEPQQAYTPQLSDMLTYVKSLASYQYCGFEVRLQPNRLGIYFRPYLGNSRPGVVFSADMDTFTGASYQRSKTPFKNVAYVIYTLSNPGTFPDGTTKQLNQGIKTISIVPGQNTIRGMQRRVVVVDATDLSDANYNSANLSAICQQRGIAALNNANMISAVAGQIPTSTPYKLGTDYFIGDIVTVKGPYGASNSAYISEYIWSNDASGFQAYPTFVTVDSV